MHTEVLVVGAGIAGLACARQLADAGKSVLVVDKSRGVGGRCATRRIDDSVVDHGLTFYHGTDEGLRASLASAGRDTIIAGWPRRVRGSGTPCQPGALRAGVWRLAYAKGVTTFPKLLAAGLEVRQNSRVATIEPMAGRWRVGDENGRQVTARDLVLAIPVPQALELLDACTGLPREFESLRWLMRDIGFVSSLTVIALYAAGGPLPEWDMWYPEDSAILQLVSHDSSKRTRPVRTALVLQALPAWSRRQWAQPEAGWCAAMLEDAGRLTATWVTRPEKVQGHRWRFARIASGGDLSGPIMIALPEGQRLGLAGDGFSPGGGVQAAWQSGRELAHRFLEDQAT